MREVWDCAGVITLIILLPTVAPVRQSGSFVFGTFFTWETVTSGITNNGYLFLIGASGLSCPHIVSTQGSERITPQGGVSASAGGMLVATSCARAAWDSCLCLLTCCEDTWPGAASIPVADTPSA